MEGRKENREGERKEKVAERPKERKTKPGRESWRCGMGVKVPLGAHSSLTRDGPSPWSPDVRGRQWGQQGMVKGRLVKSWGGPPSRQAAGRRKKKGERKWGDQERSR